MRTARPGRGLPWGSKVPRVHDARRLHAARPAWRACYRNQFPIPADDAVSALRWAAAALLSEATFTNHTTADKHSTFKKRLKIH